jgi:predicted TIM-barrel fold metal-dependent hydrolase
VEPLSHAVESDDRLIIVSSDCHAGPDRIADYESYTPAAHKEALRDYNACAEAFDAALADTGLGRGRGGAIGRDDQGMWDMAKRTEQMDADGIVAEIIFPQGAVPFAQYPAVGMKAMDWTPTPEQREVGPQIYNRWLAAFCSADPEVHYGVAVVPIDNVDAAVAEVARARDWGLRGGISLLPVREDHHVVVRNYNDRNYDRLWAACQDYEMPLNVHGASGLLYHGDMWEAAAINLTETDFFTRRALWFLIFSGVFERFPRLRLVFTEQRAHWVPQVLNDLDSLYRWTGAAELRKRLPRMPSEYFAANCFVGASFMSKTECDHRHEIGMSRLMWGSDYPHNEGVWPWIREGLRWTFNGVEEADVRRFLGGNAIDCYGFDAQRLRDRAEVIGPTVGEITADPLPAPPQDPGVEWSWAFRSNVWD